MSSDLDRDQCDHLWPDYAGQLTVSRQNKFSHVTATGPIDRFPIFLPPHPMPSQTGVHLFFLSCLLPSFRPLYSAVYNGRVGYEVDFLYGKCIPYMGFILHHMQAAKYPRSLLLLSTSTRESRPICQRHHFICGHPVTTSALFTWFLSKSIFTAYRHIFPIDTEKIFVYYFQRYNQYQDGWLLG